jgi:hypothetical protein
VLPQRLAHDVEAARERGIAEAALALPPLAYRSWRRIDGNGRDPSGGNGSSEPED